MASVKSILHPTARAIGGVAAGIAVFGIANWVMDTQVSVGIPPQWLFLQFGVALLAFLAVLWMPTSRLRGWGRGATWTAMALFGLAAFVGWTGHGGSGYWEASRMLSWTLNVQWAWEESGGDLDAVRAAVERVREETDSYFGHGELVVDGEGAGWSFTMVSPHTGRVCSVYSGVPAVWPAVTEERPRCRWPPQWQKLAGWVLLLLVGFAPLILWPPTAAPPPIDDAVSFGTPPAE